ncbi:MAG: hypothetical protein ACRCWQ_15045 [Bacilli bacterium]
MKIQPNRMLIIGVWSLSMLIFTQIFLLFWQSNYYPYREWSLYIFPVINKLSFMLLLLFYCGSILCLLMHAKIIKMKLLSFEQRKKWLFIFGFSYLLGTIFLIFSKSLLEQIVISPLMLIAAFSCLWIRRHVTFHR